MQNVFLYPPAPSSALLSILLRFWIVLETEFVCIAKQENQVDAGAFAGV